jgi:hypothetical protein
MGLNVPIVTQRLQRVWRNLLRESAQILIRRERRDGAAQQHADHAGALFGQSRQQRGDQFGHVFGWHHAERRLGTERKPHGAAQTIEIVSEGRDQESRQLSHLLRCHEDGWRERRAQAQLFGIERNNVPGAAAIECGGDRTTILHQGEAHQSDGRGADNDRSPGESLGRSTGASTSLLAEELKDRLVSTSPRRVEVGQLRRVVPDLASPGHTIDRLRVGITARFEQIIGMIQLPQGDRRIGGQRRRIEASKQNAVRVLIPFIGYHLGVGLVAAEFEMDRTGKKGRRFGLSVGDHM